MRFSWDIWCTLMRWKHANLLQKLIDVGGEYTLVRRRVFSSSAQCALRLSLQIDRQQPPPPQKKICIYIYSALSVKRRLCFAFAICFLYTAAAPETETIRRRDTQERKSVRAAGEVEQELGQWGCSLVKVVQLKTSQVGVRVFHPFQYLITCGLFVMWTDASGTVYLKVSITIQVQCAALSCTIQVHSCELSCGQHCQLLSLVHSNIYLTRLPS